MDTLASVIKKKHDNLKATRFNWESHWLEVTEHVLPRKRNVFSHRTQPGGEKRNNKVFDTTAPQAVNVLGSALQGMLTNPATQWFDLTTGVTELDNDREVKAWLQKAARRMTQVFNNSNFQTAVSELYIDLASIGTAALRVEEDDENVIRFQARPIYEHYIREDYKGLVDTISRELKMTSRQIKQKFNFKKTAKRLGEMDRFKLEKFDQDPLQEWNMIHYIAPREDFDRNLLPGVARRFKWVSVHIVEDLNIAMDVGGFEEFPFVVPRWSKTSGEIYGRSPSIEALADIKMINKMMQTHIRAGQKIVDPPLQAPDDGMSLPISTIPGGINYYRAGTPDRIIPLETNGRIDISQAMMDDVRRRIRDHYFIDQLQLNEGPQMTATEVLQRTEEKLRLLGPVLGRLHFEFLKPLIDRSFNILARKGELPPNPPEELKDRNLEVQFSSMIARAQRSSEADNITRVIGIMSPIIQAQPEVMDNVDGDKMLNFVSNLFNVPKEIFRPEDEVETVRQEREQQQQEFLELEKQKSQSESARNLGVSLG